MNERRIDDLLRYLDALTRLKAEGEFICLNEIGECLREIRAELGFVEERPKLSREEISREIEKLNLFTDRD